MDALRSVGLKWGMALIYLGLCMGLVFLFPKSLWPVLGGLYAAYFLWLYLTQEVSYGRSSGIRPLTRWDVPGFDDFRASLSDASERAGLRREPIWAVADDDIPNAWALGGRRGIVVFTTGLLKQHPPEELLAIAGHELQHLASRDSLPALLGGAWLSLLGRISAYGRNAVNEGMGRGIIGAVILLGALILDLAVGLVGWVAHFFLARRSRFAEHQADLAGARVTSATIMIAALERLDGAGPRRADRQLAKWSPVWIARELHRSHPPTPQRIAFLQTAAERGDIHV